MPVAAAVEEEAAEATGFHERMDSISLLVRPCRLLFPFRAEAEEERNKNGEEEDALSE